MKNNILHEYQLTKKEAQDIAERIRKLESLPEHLNVWRTIMELKNEYDRIYAELFEKQLRIERMIADLEPTERLLVRYRYFDNMKWETVFRKINYSQRQTFRLHDRIVKKLNKMQR